MLTHLKAFLILLAMLGLPLLSACNTASGMGEDISAAGSAMSGAAEDTKDEMTD